MALRPKRIALVGCGPGSADYLTEAARHAVAVADVLVGAGRLLELFGDSPAEKIVVDSHISPLLEQVAARHNEGRRIAVLLSGDPGLHSLARNVIERFGRDACEVVPAVSSIQVAFARLGLDWTDARILSAHGRVPKASADQLRGSDKIAILAGTKDAIGWAHTMAVALDASHAAFLAENLTLPEERFQQLPAERLDAGDVASLAIVLLIERSLLS
jgi:cobalt-precorrin-7 (C5)-methyltransferase